MLFFTSKEKAFLCDLFLSMTEVMPFAFFSFFFWTHMCNVFTVYTRTTTEVCPECLEGFFF